VAFIGLVPIEPDSMAHSLRIANAMVQSGVDILMAHIPNWIPWMEGKTLQRAAQEPRNAGISREQIFDFITALRKQHPQVPIINMTLYDTSLTMGQETFLRLSEEADVDGFDIPNYPLVSCEDKFGFYERCVKDGRHLILAISYEIATAKEGTQEYQMLLEMAKRARGFAFIMNAPGGKSGSDVKLSNEELRSAVQRVKAVMKAQGNDCYTSIVCGISGKEDIEKVKHSGAESFMIGSAYIQMLQDGKSLEEVSSYLQGIRNMCDLDCEVPG
jgi:tryptophan synthase alpha chain